MFFFYPDLPTHPYLTVLVWKSAGSMDVRPYFSEYGHRVSRKYGNHDVNECKFVASEASRRWELSFVDICIFQAISGIEVSGLSWMVKKFLDQWTFTLHQNFMEVSHLPIYGGFEFGAVSDKWLHKTDEEEEECTKLRQLRPDNNCSRKEASATAKATHTVHCFWRKCPAVFEREQLWQM